MIELLSNPQTWIAFATLTALELVLGIDNIIFISILVDKLPKEKQEFARRLGLFMAMFMRIGLLLVLAWIVGLVEPLFTIMEKGISGRDLILILGGLFLIWKSTGEIHQSLEGDESHGSSAVKATFTAVILALLFAFFFQPIHNYLSCNACMFTWFFNGCMPCLPCLLCRCFLLFLLHHGVATLVFVAAAKNVLRICPSACLSYNNQPPSACLS